MPIVTAYSEVELAQLMSATIGTTLESVLGWTAPTSTVGSYQRIVNAALRRYGLVAGQTIADATDTDKLEAAARFAVWDAAAGISPVLYDTSIGGNSRSREQIRAGILVELERAEGYFQRFDAAYAIGMTPMQHPNDPFVARAVTE